MLDRAGDTTRARGACLAFLVSGASCEKGDSGMQSEDGIVEPPRWLGTNELQPADVLLSRGHGLLSDLISELDASPYSHSALWLGDGMVLEAVSDGVLKQPLFRGVARSYVDVYRYRRQPLARAQEILQAAAAHLGQPYGWSELRLAGLVVASGRVVSENAEQRRRFTLLARAVIAMLRSLHPAGAHMVTCSMLVAKAFRDGGEPLHIMGGSRSVPPLAAPQELLHDRVKKLQARADWTAIAGMDEDEWTQVAGESAALQLAMSGFPTVPPRAAVAGNEVPDGSPAQEPRLERGAGIGFSGFAKADPLELVTPGDLAQSESLAYVGRLREPA